MQTVLLIKLELLVLGHLLYFTSRERLIVHKANIIKNDVSGKIGEVLVSQNELIIKCKICTFHRKVQGEGAKGWIQQVILG